MLVQGNTRLEIIQGDTFLLTVKFKNTNLDSIDEVYFSCKELGLVQAFVRNGEYYDLELTCDQTCEFKPVICCYDITVKFKDTRTKTAEYRGSLRIYEKVNEVVL